MTIYIALLRGINVGGNNMIKMSELKLMFEEMGFGKVQTYINSGNVLFTSENGAEQVRQRAEFEVNKAFGIAATVVIRTAAELERIIGDCPYKSDSLAAGESVQVTLLTEAASSEKMALLPIGVDGKDEFHNNGLEIYFLFRQSVLDSKLAKNMTKLGSTATSRNLNTINKLAALIKKMQ
ncbi:DUF1697 domain-containing protein [Paenibacillus psychroresistens]|uniref:DUF1697 domain-containing protein n=1 Tax=Paenibacillus psychroresistens TaxID=1778678 RepID=A0A6B8RTP2_9BACL|nr:DUF1697 domain-containing protein [Paenibacillus psychroresistens]QGQ99267.1 DUF1697 domain-containing protein [Paenibacillus psychroresistens]